ncbi:CopG family ribbon-helix-helix protein [Brevundimonas sp. M20]|uniref:CopG family ribbon-helix-helix protein n=1 Tax=Brevundimonas sp. M20 TaxID=2591463 RepID=UPI001146474D|nr:CopG family transcriptional regulator [Brevundimonas sp. M20]QDH73445.1 CopG family transcriptional regulator [Brevundimonas sp. M20]
MAKTATLNLRVSESLKSKLGLFAERTQRTPSAVAERAMEAFLDRELEMLEAVEQSREDFREGRTVSHEDAMARIRGTIDRHRSDGPRSKT